MTKYIDADLLRKEIQFAKSVYDNPRRVVVGVADAFRQDGRAAMCDDILKKIVSLQQEEPVPNDLEEASMNYQNKIAADSDVDDHGQPIIGIFEVSNAFEAGAKWDRQQMMKEAVDTTVHLESGANPIIEIGVGKFGLKVKDKVKVIIVKED